MRDDRDRWRDSKSAAHGVFVVVGVIAVAAVLLEQGNLLATLGWRGWLDNGISGTDFVLLLVVIPGVLWIVLNVVIDVLAHWRRQRAYERQRRLEWAARRKEPRRTAPPAS